MGLRYRISWVFDRLLYGVRMLPKRLVRLVLHFFGGNDFGKTYANKSVVSRVLFWLWELSIYLAEPFMIAEFFDALQFLLNSNIRRLNEEEIQEGKEMFGDRIPWSLVLLNPRSFWSRPFGAVAYVSFFGVHFRDNLSPEVLIHEFVHIWQYHKKGAVYIPRALSAQWSQEGYDYGDARDIWLASKEGRRLLDYNYEQQAQIVEDFYQILKHGDDSFLYLSNNPLAGAYSDLLRRSDLFS